MPRKLLGRNFAENNPKRKDEFQLRELKLVAGVIRARVRVIPSGERQRFPLYREKVANFP